MQKASSAWLHRTGIKVDEDALDRIAETIMDGLSAMAPPGQHQVREKMAVLIKLLAISIAALPDTEEAGREADVAFSEIGDALRLEVARFRRAAKRDGWSR